MGRVFYQFALSSKGRMAALAIFALIVTTGMAVPSHAQTAAVERSNKKQAAQSADKPVGASGQKAAIDSKTGKLRQPTADESKALNEQLNQQSAASSQSHVVTHHSNGAISTELTPEHMDATVIKINPDGTLTMECVKGMKAAEAVVMKAGAKTNQPSQAAIASSSAAPKAKAVKSRKAGNRSAKKSMTKEQPR